MRAGAAQHLTINRNHLAAGDLADGLDPRHKTRMEPLGIQPGKHPAKGIVGRDVVGKTVSERSVLPGQFGHFLSAIFDEWVRCDVGTIYVQTFEAALRNWLGMGASGMCVFNETCGTGLAIEHNGDLYACDHFVEPNYFLGNIQEQHMIELVSSPQQIKFGQDKRDTLPRYCRECDVRFACHGECPKNRFIATPDGDPGLNYLCAGFKAFFHHVDFPMKLMVGLLRRGA